MTFYTLFIEKIIDRKYPLNLLLHIPHWYANQNAYKLWKVLNFWITNIYHDINLLYVVKTFQVFIQTRLTYKTQSLVLRQEIFFRSFPLNSCSPRVTIILTLLIFLIETNGLTTFKLFTALMFFVIKFCSTTTYVDSILLFTFLTIRMLAIYKLWLQ